MLCYCLGYPKWIENGCKHKKGHNGLKSRFDQIQGSGHDFLFIHWPKQIDLNPDNQKLQQIWKKLEFGNGKSASQKTLEDHAFQYDV